MSRGLSGEEASECGSVRTEQLAAAEKGVVFWQGKKEAHGLLVGGRKW